MSGGRRSALVDALDAVIGVGASVSGDAIIQLGGVDLIRLDLRLLLAGIDEDPPGRPIPAAAPPASDHRPEARLPARVSAPGGGRATTDQGLARLVVALVELVRQLLERQAIRRMRSGSLEDWQAERLGDALQALESRVDELCDALGVRSSEVDRTLRGIDDLLGSPMQDPAAGGQGRRRVP